MADFSSGFLPNADSVPTIYTREKTVTVESSEHLVGTGGSAANRPSSSHTSESRHWENFGGMDQITVVRIDDSHIAGLQTQLGEKGRDEAVGVGVDYYEVEYSMPVEEESATCLTAGESLKDMEEEEEEGVYVIEYSNPEEEGESYQFTMSVDRQLPTKQQVKPVTSGESVPPRPSAQQSRSKEETQQRRSRRTEAGSFSCSVCGAAFKTNESLLQHAAEHDSATENHTNPNKSELVCNLCPPPGKRFKKMSGFAVHLKIMHYKEGKKNFFCTKCNKAVRSQVDLDTHTRRHANQEAAFKCTLCAASTETGQQGFTGTKWGLRKHLETEHPGVIPRCDICDKGFKSMASYLSDQFRHVGVSPFYCPMCKIYEMTERGLLVHLRNHSRKKERKEHEAAQSGQSHPPSASLDSGAENSATDESDS
ncbi:zinc finger protein 771 [Myripristis murdjan]|uniref:zinc finger protein 771 n=1 Tax=Myripristis murdjan TaxID=586833 RepID=UPI0011760BE3|nr:zinc finger protein 771-like [Myripristis murdjan]